MSLFTQFWSPNRYDSRLLLPIVPALLVGLAYFPHQMYKSKLWKLLYFLSASVSLFFGFESSITNFAPNVSGEHRYSINSLFRDIFVQRRLDTALLQSFPNLVNLPLLFLMAAVLYATLARPIILRLIRLIRQ